MVRGVFPAEIGAVPVVLANLIGFRRINVQQPNALPVDRDRIPIQQLGIASDRIRVRRGRYDAKQHGANPPDPVHRDQGSTSRLKVCRVCSTQLGLQSFLGCANCCLGSGRPAGCQRHKHSGTHQIEVLSLYYIPWHYALLRRAASEGTMDRRTGHYPLQLREGEVDRLAQQDLAFARHTARMLRDIGVAEGWHCLDLGCGPKGLTDVLSNVVGPSGRVIGLDFDAEFIEMAKANSAANTKFTVGDAYRTQLEGDQFDLVHTRFLASTAGEPETLVPEAARLARPGAIVAFQEAIVDSLQCFPPHPAWDRLHNILYSLMPETKAKNPAAARIYQLLRAEGFQDLHFVPVSVGVTSGDPWQDYLPETVESVRGPIMERGLMASEQELDETLAECRAHLDQPDTIWNSFTVLQIWGTKPAEV